MSSEKTGEKKVTVSEGSMFEMMKKCCDEGALPDCASMMKSRMGAMTGMPCCGPDAKTTEEGEK